MMILVVGGSGSGKSAYGEACMETLSQGKTKYYLATMKVLDEEDQKKVERHRQFRRGKGFVTIEQMTDIRKAWEKMEDGGKTAILECVSNLTANEMFAEAEAGDKESVVKRVTEGILDLEEKLEHLVVISSNVFEDGNGYDETTMAYIWAMGRINERIAQKAEQVIEMVAGIPVMVKGK